jgi:pimeloyl-ACP methyl ester carboxylesterase
MRPRRRLLALLATAALTACGTTSTVHTERVDSIDGAVVSSGSPSDTAPTVTNTTGMTPSDTTATSSTDTIGWKQCDDPKVHDPSLECATLQVPLDYGEPTGDTIDMALIRVPATGDRTGAMLFNPGGPGASGFDFIAFSGTGLAAALGVSSLDLIGFDPRGVERSGGIHCVSDEFVDQHLYIDETPDDEQEQALKDGAHDGFIDGCKQKYGDTLRLYSTENTARDMDAIRAAFGDEQLSYLGASYGTYLGAAYATMFPDRVRAMVLDSVVEPKGDTDEQQLGTQLVGFEGAFDHWAAWCETTSACDFKTADVGARWDALRQQLDDSPITDSDGRIANNTTMLVATQSALYSESDWPVLGQALANAEDGKAAGMLALADALNGRNDDGSFTTLYQSFSVIECASGIAARRPADPGALLGTLQAEAPRFAKNYTVADLSANADSCDKLVGPVEPIDVSYTGAGPIVLVAGDNDPATPIRWATKMLGELGSKARMVTYTGEGHGQLLSSTCIADIEGAVLADLTLPQPDAVCTPDPVVGKPDWWDGLPVPDGVSDVVSLPAVSAALGAAPTQIFSEMRTTTMSADDAVAAYTDALDNVGYQQFDAPSVVPLDHVAQGAYTDDGKKALVVIAIGPQAFDNELLQPAKPDLAPNTTVLWLVAVDA